MKKRTIILFLIILLIGILLTGCSKTGGKGPLDNLGTMITDVLEAIFGAIGTNPTVWMKFMLFIGLFAGLYGILRNDKLKIVPERIDEKTLGILTFIIALAVASLTSQIWLINIFAMFQGIFLCIVFIIPAVAAGFFMRWVWKEGKKEGHSVLWWALVAWTWFICIVIWAKIPDVTSFIVASLDRVDLGLGFVTFSQDIIGYVATFGAIFSIIMIFASGLWGTAVKRSKRQTAYTTGRRAMKGPGRIARKIFKAQELIEPSQAIKNIQDKIKAALKKVDTAKAWQAPTTTAIEELEKQMNAIINSRINAIQAYQKAFRINPGNAKKGDINKMTTALAAVEDKLEKLTEELDKVFGFTGTEAAAVTNRTDALNTAQDRLKTLRSNINTLDAEIYNVEGLLE
ncbi:hypothetical protein JW851_05105 [Candidatus Woesearchaeota archaeon]|nr:hypothetical protein [Candidatus Woesearchaeota archaeon]